jgi:UDP-2,4-diacetamido-2,4,6-trideoxy-beta-L-altropyranose hydrolase
MPMSSLVIFRTDGGAQIGLGHVRRCLSLAKSLRHVGEESFFILQGTPEVCRFVEAAGFQAMLITPNEDDLATTLQTIGKLAATTLVLDSYDLRTEYFYSLIKSGVKLVAIDDLADRELPVHLLINGSISGKDLRYHCLEETRFLLGPDYVLLRPDFSIRKKREIANKISRVLISVGGSDPFKLTPRLMQWVNNTLGDVTMDVVIGPFFQNESMDSAEVNKLGGRVVLHHDPQNIYSLMAASDLALCGGGQTTYELAATGTPAVAVRVANNQTINLQGLESAGVLVWAGDVSDPTLEEKVYQAIESVKPVQSRQKISGRGQNLIDGKGANRAAQAIDELLGVQL